MADKKRETFSSPMAIFFATLGSAVGLGNIWKFPYMVGTNGGGAFLLVYIICIVLVGLPIMISEFFIGRSTRKSPISAFAAISSKYEFIGYLYLLSTYFVLFFYSCVAGWVYLYVFKSLIGGFKNLDPEMSNLIFTNATIGPISPMLWQLLSIVVVGSILCLGVKSGIEKMTKTLMPVLFILLIIVAIRGLTLPGALEGLKFLFVPDFSLLTSSSIISALGLAFFKLSLAMGTVITYASYFTEDANMVKTGVSVAISDTIISILAGIAIFPVVFSFGLEPNAGAGLLFITIPLVFSKIPFGSILLVAFFILVAIAATGAMMSLMEVTVASLMDKKGYTRVQSVIITSCIIFAFGIFATLSYNPLALLGGLRDPLFNASIFDFYDLLSSNIIMPISGLLTALITGYYIARYRLYAEISNNGNLNIEKTFNVYVFILKYVTPILVLIIFASSLGVF
ncbi:MAG: sodium-dependent transporter [Clostridium sp.]